MKTEDVVRNLPGEQLVKRGLQDLVAGRVTPAACVVAVAGRRLENAGLLPAGVAARISDPELTLYRMLREEGGDAFSRYNALLRELVSFNQALDSRLRQRGSDDY
jgi:hypothetical protein